MSILLKTAPPHSGFCAFEYFLLASDKKKLEKELAVNQGWRLIEWQIIGGLLYLVFFMSPRKDRLYSIFKIFMNKDTLNKISKFKASLSSC